MMGFFEHTVQYYYYHLDRLRRIQSLMTRRSPGHRHPQNMSHRKNKIKIIISRVLVFGYGGLRGVLSNLGEHAEIDNVVGGNGFVLDLRS
jgi:hypothetical protein